MHTLALSYHYEAGPLTYRIGQIIKYVFLRLTGYPDHEIYQS
jgi:hypothetical protein